VQIYEVVRRSVLIEGKSVSEVCREYGLNWRTVKKMTREPFPPGYPKGRSQSEAGSRSSS
jgi:hypothetical protein